MIYSCGAETKDGLSGYYYYTHACKVSSEIKSQPCCLDKVICLKNTPEGLTGTFYGTTEELGREEFCDMDDMSGVNFFVSKMLTIRQKEDTIFFFVKVCADSLLDKPVGKNISSAYEALRDTSYRRGSWAATCGSYLLQDTLIVSNNGQTLTLLNGVKPLVKGNDFRKVKASELDALFNGRRCPAGEKGHNALMWEDYKGKRDAAQCGN